MMSFILISAALVVAAIPADGLSVSQSDVKIYVYKHSNPNKYSYSFDLSDTSQASKNIDCSKRPVLVVIHGWGGQDNYTQYEVVQAAASHHDITILGVDYPDGSYADSVPLVPTIGKYVGEFIDTLVDDICKGITYDDVRIVGHSLGAHIAGGAGRRTKKPVASIVGLDPAGPSFGTGAVDALAPTDAQVVQAIYTNGALLGARTKNGQANFYPNGGLRQPGCSALSNCSHLYALKLYAKSLSNPGLHIAQLCSSYNTITTTNQCANQPTAVLGGLIPEKASGDYYLTTSAL